jgi:flagellar biosynthesis/type III secretory pathway protein FliH
MMTTRPDAGIPVLTEIVQVVERAATTSARERGDDFPELAAAPSAGPVFPHAAEAPPAAPTRPVPTHGSEEARDARRRLEQEITGRVLQQLQHRIEPILDAHISSSLADIVQAATDSLTAGIRAGLQQALEQIVAQAVAEELAKLRSDKTKHS